MNCAAGELVKIQGFREKPVFYPVERSNPIAPINVNSITNMKTRILSWTAALFTFVALSAVSMADPAASQAFTSRPNKPNASPQAQRVLNDRCKAAACCSTRTVSDGIGGGRAAKTAFKSIVTCDRTCSIGASEQRSICRKGMRA